MLDVLILIIASVLNLSLGTLVYIKNPASMTNRYFFIMTSSFVLWSTANYLSVQPVWIPQIVWVRMVIMFAVLLCLSVFLLFQAFPSFHNSQGASVRRFATLSAFIMMCLTLTPWVFTRLEIVDGSVQPVPGPLIVLFALEIVSLLSGATYTIVRKYRRATGRAKLQLRSILAGIGVTIGLIVLTNFVFVVAFKNTNFIKFGPAYTLIFSATLAHAIVKHKLFDIRAAVARGIGYLSALATLGLLYGILLFAIANALGKASTLTVLDRVMFISVALISALAFPSTKRFFDRITNRFFYRDAYDPQIFFNQINTTLAEKNDIQELVHTSLRIIAETLRAESAAYIIEKTKYKPRRFIAYNMPELERPDLLQLEKAIAANEHTVIVADYLDDKYDAIRSVMADVDIAAIVRVGGIHAKREVSGLLLLKAKKSGNPYTRGDIGLLEAVANELVVATENALRYEEIEKFNETLRSKVEVATYKLRSTNEKLKKLDETKDEFISMASHQLRTPLTSVKGYLSMVLEGDAGPLKPQQEELLKQSYMSSQRMVNLIADLLNLSRLNTGKFVIDAKPTDLRVIVDQEVAQLRESAKAKSITLTWDIPQTFSLVGLDEGKMHQVVMNFIDNAIYYTPEGGTIAVGLTETATAVEFRVKDSGIGVPRALQRHLFTKFYRADNARRMRPDGTGLGIYMAKKVIAAQGGSVIFESEEGKGSTFGFRFSKTRASRPDPEQTEQPEQA